MSHKLTYLQYNLKDSRLIRWPDNCMPIKFYTAPFRWYRGKGEEGKYYGMVMNALREWERISGGKVRFQIVNNLNDSQINLEWKRVDRKSLGYCLFNFDNQVRLYSAEVQIGLSDGILHQNYMDENEVYHTILHEIGHAVGLGHSPNRGDIMYTPHQYGCISLSKRDVNTLNWLYTFPCAASAGEVASKYRLNDKNFDDIVMKIVNDKPQSEFERVKNGINPQDKDLLKESASIAELKKYQVLMLQNVQISEKTHNLLKQQQPKAAADEKNKFNR